MHLKSAIFVIAAVIILASLAPGQTTMGTLTGLVSDTSGAVIPNITVTARNLATGSVAETATSATGNFVLMNLQVGTYELTVSNPGFKTWNRRDLGLSSNQTIRVDITLEVGQVSERLQVTAEAPAIKTESTEVSSTMERKLLENMPLPIAGIGGGMRNAFSIMMMLPQVKSGDGQSAWDDLQVGGGQQHDWNVSVDGLSVEMGWRNHVGYMNRLTPSVDAIEEFRIDTAAFKAEDSRVSGGNITIVTKSGTNDLHGSLFDYYQSQKLDANSWLNNKRGRPKSVYHRNDFGATVGGPVYIPKLYNGRDKSWFYFSYEGYRYPQTSGITEQTIPLPEMRSGDFSRWVQSNGAVIPIYDPTTTRSDGAGGFTREVFAGNLIPASRISPISRKIASYFPDPNAAGLVRNYVTYQSGPRKRTENAYLLKGDHNFGVKNRLSFTFTRNNYRWNNAYDQNPEDPNNWPATLPYPLASRPDQRLYVNGDQYHGYVYRLNDTHTITPTMINTLTIGFHRLTHPEHDVTAFKENWSQVLGGIKNNPNADAHFPAVRFNTDNYYGWESTKYWDEYHNVYGIDENVNWVKGSHNFKFGYAYQMLMLNRDNHNQAAGDLFFHRLETSRPQDNSGTSGSSFASFLLGAVDNGTFNIPNATLMRWPYHALFVQDDWKITPRLTANFGFRFEMDMPVYEKHDRVSYFDANLINPVAGVPGALRFLGDGTGREGQRTFYDAAKGYGPRAGLAWQVTPTTVIRAGAGIFYSPIKYSASGTGFTLAPSWATADLGVTPAFYWDSGWPAWTAPPIIDPGFNTGQSVSWAPQNELQTLPSTTTWNFAVSRPFRDFVLDATYTGSKGTHLASDRVNYMQVDPKYASLGSLLNKAIDDPDVVAAGFRPPFANFKQVLGSRATLAQSLRMFPQYAGVGTGGMQNHSGNSTYHALILSVNRRYSSGLTMLGSFTWSKLLTDSDSAEPWIAGVVGAGVGAGAAQNHYNRGVEKSYGVLDFPYQFKLTASYDLPFGKGKTYLTEGVLMHVLGGWNVGTFVLAQSGYPMGVVDSAYNSNLFAGTARPNVLTHDWRAPVAGDAFDPDRDLFLMTSPFQRRTNPAADPFGSAPRFIGDVRSFGRIRENITVTRNIAIVERFSADLRWEVYDLFNHKTWSNPASLDLANTQFGKITNASGNRSMQLGLRLRF